MEQSFLTWYYTRGTKGAFEVWLALTKAWWRKSNILDLFQTLFSPWHRDVSAATWVGLHPILWLERLTMNVISRFMGSVVRSLTIGTLLISFALFLIGGFFLVAAFLTAPLMLVLSVVFFLTQSALLGLTFLMGIVGLALGLYGYLHRNKELLDSTNLLSFQRSEVFESVARRLGCNTKQEQEVLRSLDGTALLAWLQQKNLEEKDLQMAVAIEKHFFDTQKQREHFWSDTELTKWSRIGKSWKYGYTIHLDRYSSDFSASDYSEYSHDDLYGKQSTLQALLGALERNTQNSVLLIGNPGIGKQSTIHYLGKLIRENALRATLFDDMRVLWFDLLRVISDADAHGEEVEDNLRRLFTEATLAGNCILAIPHFERVLLPDNKGRNFRPLIEEFLGYPNFRAIGLTDTGGKLALEQNASQALGLLELIEMTEPDEEETFLILLSEFHEREKREGMFTLKALKSIIKNAENMHWETPFPERAIDLTESILVANGGSKERLITEEMVNEYLVAKTGIPRGTISEDEKDKLLNLEEHLHTRVIGQRKAIEQIAEALRKARAGFANTKRPIGSFLFLGPTGVGKTETAKALAHVYFGGEEKMIRLDMSEFQTDEAVDRLIGSSSKGIFGAMTTAVAQAPYSILLLDELEKAYPRALDLFLQILDEGFVTDGYGQKINFRNCIIIATSNAGSIIQKQLHADGVEEDALQHQVIDHIVETGVYRLEFLNRFDSVVFFLPLVSVEMMEVVKIKLQGLATRLHEEKNISLSFEEGVVEALVEKGYDPVFGARSLNRFISDTLEDQIAKALINGDVVAGGEMIIRKETLVV
jgi:ATP-dependent Clp protease ATP-binding subunit ClpA